MQSERSGGRRNRYGWSDPFIPTCAVITKSFISVIISPSNLVYLILVFHLELGDRTLEEKVSERARFWVVVGREWVAHGAFNGMGIWPSFRSRRSDQHLYLWAPILAIDWPSMPVSRPCFPLNLWYIWFRARQSSSMRVTLSQNALCFSAPVQELQLDSDLSHFSKIPSSDSKKKKKRIFFWYSVSSQRSVLPFWYPAPQLYLLSYSFFMFMWKYR